MTGIEPLPTPETSSSPGLGGSGEIEEHRSIAIWIARRLLLSLVVLFGVSVMVFFATQALPGDPAVQILGQTATPEQLTALRQQLGLDQPLLSQYVDWLGNLLTGSLGESLTSPQSVRSLVVPSEP